MLIDPAGRGGERGGADLDHEPAGGRDIAAEGLGIAAEGLGIAAEGLGIAAEGRGIQAGGRGAFTDIRGIPAGGRGIRVGGRGSRAGGYRIRAGAGHNDSLRSVPRGPNRGLPRPWSSPRAREPAGRSGSQSNTTASS